MSEKNNGQGTAQWSKGAVASAAQKQQQQIQQGISPIYNPNNVGAALYGGGGGGGVNQHDVVSYASARFQAPPPLDHHHAAPPPSTSNVPVPSGFVPPPFTATAVTTSVLTPNPYAAQSTLLSSTSHPHAHHQPAAMPTQQFPGQTLTPPHHVHAHFGMDQFQHLNAQQQYELSKLMVASFSSNQMTSVGPTNLTSSSSTAGPISTTAVTPTLSPSAAPSSAMSNRQPHTPLADVASTSSGTINSQLAEQVISTISTGSSGSKLAATPIHGRLMGLGVNAPDEEKLRRIQEVVESGIGDHAKQEIVQILDRISTLRPVEKLLLYLRLPGEQPETDPLRQPQNPLGTRSEINHTINWVRTHLEQDPQVSIPKQDVYNDYLIYCDRLNIKPLSTADFGKVMKQVFPGIRPRRLGTRGHSRYCYAAMRKTSKLPAPHLPTLSTTLTSIKGEAVEGGVADAVNTTIIDNTETDREEESWSVVKQWAENVLHVKVNDVKDLAKQIKASGSVPHSAALNTQTQVASHTTAAGGTSKTSNVIHKKYAQREPKEKRAMVDMGPLKKRRKKKRKGSSSSESSCQQSNPATSEQGPPLKIQPQLSPANSSKSSQQNVLSPVLYLDDGQQSFNMVKIKQEIIDSPSYPTTTATSAAVAVAQSIDNDSKNIPLYHTQLNQNPNHLHHHHQQQQQIMPINLATETRGGIVASRPPPSTITAASAFEHVARTPPTTMPNSNTTTAVKNLTPKIMELAAENPIASLSPPLGQTIIKQEVGVDDYNTANIFCKKVLKAQQTKGVWPNSPTSNRTSASRITLPLPIITTTASTPPPVPASVITSPTNSSTLDTSSGGITTTNYSMGPPAQMAPSTSPSNNSTSSSLHEDAMGQPKVVSRNLQQLRAKKLLTVNPATCDPPDLSAVKEAADLPENLGLPRERVISICNMDKHELDDYFLPVEEENSEDQETELLQYFQMGDAEEKLTKNSSSDAKRHSYPTVPVQMMSSAQTSTSTSTASSSSVAMSSGTQTTTTTATSARQMLTMINANRRGGDSSAHTTDIYNGKPTKQLSQQALNYLKSAHLSSSLNREPCGNSKQQTSSSKTATTSAVGTASASLEQITHNKHQQHYQLQNQNQTTTTTTTIMPQTPQQHLQQPPQPQPPTKVSYKRKINLNTASSSSDITAARKNYSFLPISPNINTTTTSLGANHTPGANNNVATGFFASPGFNRLLTKQQSLDCESSSDPMIGATRRRRPFMSTMTSASAPPSPSVLKQQQEQHIFAMSHNILLDQWSSSNASAYNNNSASNHSNAVLVDQNSLDLDLFGEAAAAAASATTTNTCSLLRGDQRNINNSNQCGSILTHNENQMVNNDSIINDLTQRSRSVPLSQLQRSHSPTFNRTFHMTAGGGGNTSAYSACNSLAQTPVPSEFIDSVTMLSENSCSQQSSSIKLEEVGGNVVGSDSTALLDDVDVSDILSSPDFVTKFSNISHSGGTGTKTSCSSAGSSSGYSSAGQFSLSLSSYGSNGGVGGCVAGGVMSSSSASVSRSVPSTPLPHHNAPNLLGNGSNFYRRRFGNNCQPLNNSGGVFMSNFSSTSGKYGYGNMNSALSRSACDISKSMPSTPITTTPSSFRYSPSEFTRDFLINGNTIDDSITSSFGTVGADNLMSSDVVGVDVPLHSDALLNEEDSLVNGPSDINRAEGVISPVLVGASGMVRAGTGVAAGGESSSSVVIGVGSDILDNL